MASGGDRVGEVTHFYERISVAVLRLNADLSVGDTVHFLGRHSDFQQEITSMEIEHKPVAKAEAGGEVAVKTKQRVRPGDSVFRL